jgi:phosphatidylserine decarboxylase
MVIELIFDDNGRVAFLRESVHGLVVAKLLVNGTLVKKIDSVANKFNNDIFYGVINEISYSEYIDKRTESIRMFIEESKDAG